MRNIPTLNLLNPGVLVSLYRGFILVILDEEDKACSGVSKGALAIKYPWPSIARTIAGDHERYCSTYFHQGYYITGDGASRDEAGDYWINGRIDDVLNVSGHRLGTAEIESAIMTHTHVAEVAVVGVPHPIKGQGIYAFVSLKEGDEPSAQLEKELIEITKKMIGGLAKPDTIRWVNDLPKTRSGKIMRRILRLVASDGVSSPDELGDLSTLANPKAVEDLF